MGESRARGPDWPPRPRRRIAASGGRPVRALALSVPPLAAAIMYSVLGTSPGQTVPVPVVSRRLHLQAIPGDTHAHAHRRATLSVRHLPEALHAEIQSQHPQTDALRYVEGRGCSAVAGERSSAYRVPRVECSERAGVEAGRRDTTGAAGPHSRRAALRLQCRVGPSSVCSARRPSPASSTSRYITAHTPAKDPTSATSASRDSRKNLHSIFTNERTQVSPSFLRRSLTVCYSFW